MTNRNALLGRSRPREKLTRGEIAALDEATVPPVPPAKLPGKKGGRNGVVVRGVGGPGAGSNPGGGTVRIGGRVPWGAEVDTPTAPGTTAGAGYR